MRFTLSCMIHECEFTTTKTFLVHQLVLEVRLAALIRVLHERFRYCDVHVGQEGLSLVSVAQGRHCGLMVAMKVMQDLLSGCSMLVRGRVELGLG